MNALNQSATHNSPDFLSIPKDGDNIVSSVNGHPLEQYDGMLMFNINKYPSPSEYLRTLSSVQKIIPYIKGNFRDKWMESNINKPRSIDHTVVNNILNNNTIQIENLKQQIQNVYNKHQEKNWDGYDAEPIKYLSQSLQFASALFSESQLLIESIEIVPENDGCLCFEWFKSHKNYITISIKNDKLIYNYTIGDEKGCGEASFAGKEMLINQIRKIF